MRSSSSKPLQPKIRQGFTLVELQIAILIMAMLTLMLTAGLRSTVITWDKTSQHQDIGEHRFLLNQFLRRHISNMRFYQAYIGEDGRFISFFGERQSLHFVAPHPSYEGGGDLYWWTLKNDVAGNSSNGGLILEYLPFSGQRKVDYVPGIGVSDEDIVPEVIVVDETVELIDIKYVRREESGANTWWDSWEPGQEAPSLIELQLKQSQGQDESHQLVNIGIAPPFSQKNLSFAGQVDGT